MGFDIRYTYDAAGNRIRKSDGDTLVEYVYSAANRLVSETLFYGDWTDADVGSPTHAGSSSYDGPSQVWTVRLQCNWWMKMLTLPLTLIKDRFINLSNTMQSSTIQIKPSRLGAENDE